MVLKKIEKLCIEKGISISCLEKECSIGNGTIARWDVSSPRIDNLQKVANYFRVPVDYFLKGSE